MSENGAAQLALVLLLLSLVSGIIVRVAEHAR